MSIDPNDAPEGYVAFPATAQVGWPACSNCAFDRRTCPVRRSMLRCVPANRVDKQHVIFVRKEQRVD